MLVFDIETVANTDRLSPVMLEYLQNRSSKRDDDKAERDIALNPYVLQVASLAMQVIEDDEVLESKVIYLETDQARVFESTEKEITYGGCNHKVSFVPVYTESGSAVDDSKLIEAFWECAANTEKVVTYNGSGFDVPAFQARAMLLGISPGRNFYEIGKFRNNPDPYWHIDLADLLSFGDFRHRYSLDFLCNQFGIESPKGDIDGAEVGNAFNRGEHLRIAEYNIKDVLATAALYRRVKSVIKGTNSGTPANVQPLSDNQKTALIKMLANTDKVKHCIDARLSRLSKGEASALIGGLKKLLNE